MVRQETFGLEPLYEICILHRFISVLTVLIPAATISLTVHFVLILKVLSGWLPILIMIMIYM